MFLLISHHRYTKVDPRPSPHDPSCDPFGPSTNNLTAKGARILSTISCSCPPKSVVNPTPRPVPHYMQQYPPQLKHGIWSRTYGLGAPVTQTVTQGPQVYGTADEGDPDNDKCSLWTLTTTGPLSAHPPSPGLLGLAKGTVFLGMADGKGTLVQCLDTSNISGDWAVRHAAPSPQ